MLRINVGKRMICKEGVVNICEHPDCEHCGDLEPFDFCYSDGGTYWCYCCANANGNDLHMSEEFKTEVVEAIRKAKTAYYVEKSFYWQTVEAKDVVL